MNRYIEKLDKRYAAKNGKSLARNRKYGDVIERHAPDNVPSDDSVNHDLSSEAGTDSEKDNVLSDEDSD